MGQRHRPSGYSFAKKLLEKDNNVIGIDNLNSYYSVSLKESRIKDLISFFIIEILSLAIKLNDTS